MNLKNSLFDSWVLGGIIELFTLSFGSWIHKMSGIGLPTTSQVSVMLAPLSASTDFGRSLKTGPSDLSFPMQIEIFSFFNWCINRIDQLIEMTDALLTAYVDGCALVAGTDCIMRFAFDKTVVIFPWNIIYNLRTIDRIITGIRCNVRNFESGHSPFLS